MIGIATGFALTRERDLALRAEGAKAARDDAHGAVATLMQRSLKAHNDALLDTLVALDGRAYVLCSSTTRTISCSTS